ncbi:MAG: putative multidrug resistance protein [Labilithrix sp.]|nr:putative multidrug resistance protein [Labilithrix sp.]
MSSIGGTSERAIVFCVGAVQFVNILDFMIVLPLGPDFATALDIPLSHIGYVGGSYTAAASISGLAGAFFLDRFDRKKALSVAMAGLVLGTFSGAFATGLGTLMLARVVAGAFGGPATSLSYSIIADVIPPERRGRAMGAVMGAFSIASILGVPAGLELARRGGWRLPFIAVGVLGAVLGTYAHAVLPPMFGHLALARQRRFGRDLLELVRADVFLSLLMTTFVMAASFIVIPNIAPYLLYNLGYPRARLGLLYLVGGAVSFVAMRGVGVLVDRFGSARVATFGTVFVSVIMYLGFARVPPVFPVMLIFVLFMLAMAFRNVAYNTLTSKVPLPAERARFSSIQSSVQHLASALAAFASTQFLSELPDHSLVGVNTTAYVSIVLGACALPLMWTVEHRVLARRLPR